MEFIDKAKQMIKEAKQFHALDTDSQNIMQLTKQMFTHQNNRDYPELVQTMISLKYIMNAITQNSSENMDIELQASIKQRKHIA